VLRLAWRPRSRKGFFLRAEDFFGYLRNQARIDARVAREAREFAGYASEEDVSGPGAVHPDERGAEAFLAEYDSRSHGESFIDLFTSRVHAGGLYLLDEPEAPLSPTRQLGLLGLIMRAAEKGAQFIIATHSPILLACPSARIFSFDSAPIEQVAFADLEHVNVMRDFLNHTEMYLRRLRKSIARRV
jgi:predicted ATPase